MHCVHRFLWPTGEGSRSTKTTCAPVLYWITRKSSTTWLKNQGPDPLRWKPPRTSRLYVQKSVRPRKNGRPSTTACGKRAKQSNTGTGTVFDSTGQTRG